MCCPVILLTFLQNACYELPLPMQNASSGFLASGSPMEAALLPLLPSTAFEWVGDDSLCPLDLVLQASVDVLSANAGSILGLNYTLKRDVEDILEMPYFNLYAS